MGAETYIILFCEGYTEPQKVSFEEVRQSLHEDVFEKKQRIAMARAFEELKDRARIDNFLAGTMQTPNRKVDYKALSMRRCNQTPSGQVVRSAQLQRISTAPAVLPELFFCGTFKSS